MIEVTGGTGDVGYSGPERRQTQGDARTVVRADYVHCPTCGKPAHGVIVRSGDLWLVCQQKRCGAPFLVGTLDRPTADAKREYVLVPVDRRERHLHMWAPLDRLLRALEVA